MREPPSKSRAMQKEAVGHDTEMRPTGVVLSTSDGADQPGVAEATVARGTVAMTFPATMAAASRMVVMVNLPTDLWRK